MCLDRKAQHFSTMAFRPTNENIAIMRSYWEDGSNNVDIYIRLNCSLNTVNRWVTQFNAELNGGPVAGDQRINNSDVRKLSAKTLDNVVRVLVQNPFQAIKRLTNQLNLNVGEKTLGRNLKSRRDKALF